MLAGLYYTYNGAFGREHRSVLYGKLMSLGGEDAHAHDQAFYALRRNIHRLEKGLIMRPRRNVFAKTYIGETVAAYVRQASNGNCDAATYGWASDVLHSYFEAVPTGADDVVDQAREAFASCQEQGSLPRGRRYPYHRDTSPLPVDLEGLMQLAHRRRSVRWYLPEPVPREIIDNAIRVALYSPSACNRQPFEFRVYDDPKLVQKIGALPAGSAGFNHNFPAIVVLVGLLRAFPADRDRHVIYVDGGLAAMAFQFGLEVQGVSSCCINWPNIEDREQRMEQALSLAPDERPIMLISLGYPDPDGLVPYSQKKPLDAIRSYNRT